MNVDVLERLRYLKTWFAVGGALWGFGGAALIKLHMTEDTVQSKSLPPLSAFSLSLLLASVSCG